MLVLRDRGGTSQTKRQLPLTTRNTNCVIVVRHIAQQQQTAELLYTTRREPTFAAKPKHATSPRVMGYSGNPGTGPVDHGDAIYAIVAFVALALYNAIELNVVIFSSFRRFKGLYFWSFVAATNGIIPHSIGFLLKNVIGSHNYGVYITLVAIGWVPMVTGQSLVLYSRLHLIFWNQLYLRLVLGMIIVNAFILHTPIIILMYGSNSSPNNSWVHPYVIYEKIQVTMFFLQELIISAIYIKCCFSFFDVQDSLYGDGVRRMRRHLLWVNILVILLDIPILCLEYADYYDMQTAYKAFVYSVKLKLEFRILNKLVEMTNERHSVDPFRDSSSLQIQHVSSGSTACQSRGGNVS